MRFAISRHRSVLRALVVALDDERTPIAETWRAVGDSAVELGFPRPGYHAVRRLVRAERARRTARRERRDALRDALAAIPSPLVADHLRSIERVVDARRRELLVLEQHERT